MTNAEVFRNYGSEQWVVEQNLEFFLQEYWDAIKEKVGQPHSQMPVNPVGFTKEFMGQESYTETKYAEMSKMETLEKNEVVAITNGDVQHNEIEDAGNLLTSFSFQTFRLRMR